MGHHLLKNITLARMLSGTFGETVTLPQLEQQITDAVEKLSASVVNITSRRLAAHPLGTFPIDGAGTGVSLAPEGLLMTNHHVLDGASSATIIAKDGTRIGGKVLGSDPATDLAVIRVAERSLPAAPVGDSSALKVGQLALAIGHSLGLPGGPTVSTGVVSALSRPLPGTDFIFEGLIQTDAAINPGNSGGPLADIRGTVIGINATMMPGAQGVGFAIPANTVRWVMGQILEHGRVVRPWLGISCVTLTPEIARRAGVSEERGVLIIDTAPWGPADAAGLAPGDVLQEMAGQPVRQTRDMLTISANAGTGTEIEVTMARRGRSRTVTLRLEEAPPEFVPRRTRAPQMARARG